MLSDVLRYIADRDGAPVTEIKKAFGLPAEMAAELCIQLQDAGFVADQVLEPCHHLEGASSCTTCSGASCSSGAEQAGRQGGEQGGANSPHGHHMAEILADAFKKGCCGMNAPYFITASGRSYLEAAAPTAV